MPRGGARNRSGPAADPNSGRSERRGFKLTALPAEGFKGAIPEFPLPDVTSRELELWDELWRTPQACAWSMPSEAWRTRSVALYTRIAVRCESPTAGSSLIGQLHRFADQIGLTTAGLAEMGWKVAEDQLSVRAPAKPEPRQSSRDRLSVVNGGD